MAFLMTYMSPIAAVRRRAMTRPVILLLVMLGAAVSPTMAMNIYDVVQLSSEGYSDEEIIVIIDATESVFELTTGDIAGLNNLGISPRVIDAMMQRSESAEQPDAGPAISPVPTQSSPPASTSPANTYPAPAASVPRPFSISIIREEGSGEHRHFTVDLYGAKLLVLRNEGRYRSTEDRARSVAQRLDAARRSGPGEFREAHTNGEDVVVFSSNSGKPDVLIAVVSGSDAIAYDVRSERRVTTDLLAMYWAALLNDYWTIAFERQPPERLRHLHRGEALMLLYAVIRNTPDDEEFSLVGGVQQLPKSIQAHLERLALAVPDDF